MQTESFFTPGLLAELVGGVWENLTPDLQINAFNYIPKFTQKGDLFVIRHDSWPNVKTQYNQHRIPDVIAKGVSAIMVNADVDLDVSVPVLKVPDTYQALRKIANEISLLSKTKRVVSVGSYGKTAFKIHLWHLIKDHLNTYARFSSSNFSASTYCDFASLKKNTEVLLLEKPVSTEKKVLRRIKAIAPTICVLTAIGHEHIEKHGSIANLIKLKTTFAAGLGPGGKMLVPADSEYYDDILQALQRFPDIQILTFGSSPACNAALLDARCTDFAWDVVARIEDKVVAFRVPFPETYAPVAALAELLCAHHLGVDVYQAAVNYYRCTNYKSSGKLYRIRYQNKSFHLYDQSERGGIEGYAEFFKTLRYFKPKNGGKKIVVSSGFVDHVDGETAYIDHAYFKSLISAAKIDSLFTVEYFTEHIKVLPDKSIWRNHSLDVNSIKDEVIDSIADNDIVCVKGIAESELPSFIRYIKRLPSISVREVICEPLNHGYDFTVLKDLTVFSPSTAERHQKNATDDALEAWSHISALATNVENTNALFLFCEEAGSWYLYRLSRLSSARFNLELHYCSQPNNAEAMECVRRRLGAFNRDKNQRFSQSPVWDLQKKYYQSLGVDSWSKALVPFNATSNAFIAHRYALVIRAFILDSAAKHAHSPLAPINIVELGTGHGRFSFLLLKALEICTQDLTIGQETPLYRYIMTDVAESNVQVWQRHPQLQAFVAGGKLDFSLFDADEPQAPHLRVSGELLTERLNQRPLIIVANFFLDVLAYDLFRVRKGAFEQCTVTYRLPDEMALTDPLERVIENMRFQQQFKPAPFPYYDDSVADQVLQGYCENLRDSVFQFPVIATQTYRFFDALTGDCLWLLSEEADSRCAQLEGNHKVGLKNAGSFTCRVNLHALFQYARRLGAVSLEPAAPDARYDSFGILKVDATYAWNATRQAFTQNLLHFGPKDYFRLLVSLYKTGSELNPDGCISFLELGYCDPYFVYRFRKVLSQACKLAEGYKRAALEKLLLQSWEHYYDLGEDFNYAYNLGHLLFNLRSYQHAQRFFSLALINRPVSYPNYYWLGRCAEQLQQYPEAQHFYQEALVLNSENEASLRRLETVVRKMSEHKDSPACEPLV